MARIKLPIGNKTQLPNFNHTPSSPSMNNIEHIPQSHFVKKTEREAITKHIPVEEPFTTGSFKVDDNEFHITHQSTSSYDPHTFKLETSYQSVLEAIENGKDTDLVAMPVGEVRKMQERITLLEKEVMKSKSPSGKLSLDIITKMDMAREQLQADTKRIEWSAKHKHETDLRREEIKRQIAMSKGWDKMFDS